MRLNRYIARSGVTSRRKADELILSGKVFVNDKVSSELGKIVEPGDRVVVNGEEISLSEKVYLAFNKPTGYATTKSDPHERHTIFDILPNDSSLFPVGRLDRDTSGLLIITNDGNFAQNIIHPSKKIEKEYIVRTKNEITDDQTESLQKGIELEDGFAKPKIVVKNNSRELMITIEMGKKRIVRRLVNAVGNEVSGLVRTRIGDIKLDIPVGQTRALTGKEVAQYV
jgi:23S rRNA pseudouridine2605 synthase